MKVLSVFEKIKIGVLQIRWDEVFLPISLLIFVCLAGYDVQYPGLYYDELLFTNAALGGKIDMFIHLRIGELPVMLMPYIGALKAWLYYPLFKLFDVTAFSIRWPVVVIGALTLWINYCFMKTAFSRAAAIIFLLLAAVEPSTLFHTRLDWGPTVLMMLFRGILLLSIFAWLKTGKSWFLFAAAAVSILGAFDKLNFIWFVAAAFSPLGIIYPDRILSFVRLHRDKAIALGVLGAVCAAGFVAYANYNISVNQEVGQTEWHSRWGYVVNMLRETVSGTSVYEFIIGSAGDMASRQLYILGAAILSALLIFAVTIRNFGLWRPLIFMICFVFIVLAQIFITRQATGPHHAAMLAPFWLIPIALGLSRAFDVQGIRGIFLKIIAMLAIILVCVSSLTIDLAYLKGFRSSVRNPNWDAGSYEMVNLLKRNTDRPIICVDWGLGTVIYGILNEKAEVHDRWPTFKDRLSGLDAEYFEKNIISRKPLFVVRAVGKENFPKTRQHFFDTVNKRGWKLQKFAEVNGMEGTPLNEIYSVSIGKISGHK